MSKFDGIAVLVASSGRTVSIEWALSLATFAYPLGMNVMWFMAKGDKNKIEIGEMTRDLQRESLAEKAIEVGADYLMFLDDDTIAPNYTIQWLHKALANNHDAAICGGIYCTKEPIPQPIVFDELGGGPSYRWTVGDVFECKGLGTGCMLVKTSCLKDIPKPWFKDFNDAPFGKTVKYGDTEVKLVRDGGTDDLYFCKKVSSAGYKILAHGGVLPVHVGQDGTFYTLPTDIYPCTSFETRRLARIAEASEHA